MKSKVSFLFILLILAVSASAGAESEGGTLTIGLSVEPFTIDPAGGVYISEALLIQQIYDPLIFSDLEASSIRVWRPNGRRTTTGPNTASSSATTSDFTTERRSPPKRLKPRWTARKTG